MNPSKDFERFEDAASAVAAIVAVVKDAGRDIAVHTRVMEESIWEDSTVIAVLRDFLTERPMRTLRVLIDEPAALQRGNTYFMSLAQRLSSRIEIREPDPDQEKMDHEVVVTDREGLLKWDIQSSARGNFARVAPADARQVLTQFDRIWERARPCSEFRALGI